MDAEVDRAKTKLDRVRTHYEIEIYDLSALKNKIQEKKTVSWARSVKWVCFCGGMLSANRAPV